MTAAAATSASRAPATAVVEKAVAAGLARDYAERAAALDLYPTPPWGFRALWHTALPELRGAVVAEPADGLGSGAAALAEVAAGVVRSDIAAWPGRRPGPVSRLDFLAPGAWEANLDALGLEAVDWIVTNPPFVGGGPEAFLERALDLAAANRVRAGVALLVRASFREGQKRHDLFRRARPAAFWTFAERLPMGLGRFVATTAQAYAWCVVRFDAAGRPCGPVGADGEPLPANPSIPPGARALLQRPGDPDFGLKPDRAARPTAWRLAATDDGRVLWRPAGRGEAATLDWREALAEARRLAAAGEGDLAGRLRRFAAAVVDLSEEGEGDGDGEPEDRP